MDCTWPVSFSECGPCPALEVLDDEGRERWARMAGEFLWRWTGRVFGECPVTLRPCRSSHACSSGSTFWGRGPYGSGGGSPWQPVLVAGRWRNVACGTCGDRCDCDGSTACLRLPGPVSSITAVTIGGTVLDPAAYRVDNGAFLVRTDGGSWPVTQDLALPAGDPGTWSVEYVYGTPVPEHGRTAAGLLACELAKAACNDSTCRLPQRVQTVSRQGITMTVLDQMETIDEGKTGIWLIDSFVASVTKPARSGTVRSVDVPVSSGRVKTWP